MSYYFKSLIKNQVKGNFRTIGKKGTSCDSLPIHPIECYSKIRASSPFG